MADIFISYSRTQQEIANELNKRFKKLGYDVFLDTEVLEPGDKWLERLKDEVRHADLLVILVSETANVSQYVTLEMVEALKYNKRIVPVRINKTSLPTYLKDFQAISFLDDNYDDIVQRIHNVFPNSLTKFIRRYGLMKLAFSTLLILAIVIIAWQMILLSRNAQFDVVVPVPCPLNSSRSLNALANDNEATIMIPPDCSIGWRSGVRLDVSGEYSGDLEDRILWILVYIGNNYYPQSISTSCGQPERVQSVFIDDHMWTSQIVLGTPGDEFDIVLVSVDGSESEIFANWLDEGCNAGFTGFAASQLPSGLIEHDAVTIRSN